MKTLQDRSHAKLNLWLHVKEKLPNGYHILDTCFQALDIHDLITYEFANTFEISCSIPELENQNNIVSKAARLLSEYITIPKVKINIQKSIPIEAGLGGGSSNAASALYCLNLMAGNILTKQELMPFAEACGSDVPFFLTRNSCAIASGKGEILNPIPTQTEQSVLLVKPAQGNSTAEMYQRLDQINSNTESDNDFEQIANSEVQQILKTLRPYGKTILCGSGSAIACFYENEIPNAAFPNCWQTVTKTIQRIEEPKWIA